MRLTMPVAFMDPIPPFSCIGSPIVCKTTKNMQNREELPTVPPGFRILFPGPQGSPNIDSHPENR